MREKEISPELVRKILQYNPKSGLLYWRSRPKSMFSKGGRGGNVASARSWNARFDGKEAFTSLNQGYRQGWILGYNYRAHRAIWAIVHGEWPKDQIDHINGIRDDNRLHNLRDVSNSENSKNEKLRITNTSGVTGVRWNKKSGKWIAQVNTSGKTRHLGCFDNVCDAVAARKEADKEYGFHKNHGRLRDGND